MGGIQGATITFGRSSWVSSLILASVAFLLASAPSHALPGFAPKGIYTHSPLVLAQGTTTRLQATPSLNRAINRSPSTSRHRAVTPNTNRRVILKTPPRTTKSISKKTDKTAPRAVVGTSGLRGLAGDSRVEKLKQQRLKGKPTSGKTGIAGKTPPSPDTRKQQLTKTKPGLQPVNKKTRAARVDPKGKTAKSAQPTSKTVNPVMSAGNTDSAKVVGPAWKDVTAKYKGDNTAKQNKPQVLYNATAHAQGSCVGETSKCETGTGRGFYLGDYMGLEVSAAVRSTSIQIGADGKPYVVSGRDQKTKKVRFLPRGIPVLKLAPVHKAKAPSFDSGISPNYAPDSKGAQITATFQSTSGARISTDSRKPSSGGISANNTNKASADYTLRIGGVLNGFAQEPASIPGNDGRTRPTPPHHEPGLFLNFMESTSDKPLLMPVGDVFSISGRGTVATGRVERGVINAGASYINVHTDALPTGVSPKYAAVGEGDATGIVQRRLNYRSNILQRFNITEADRLSVEERPKGKYSGDTLFYFQQERP